MKQLLFWSLTVLPLSATYAEVPRTRNLLRDAVTPVVLLAQDKSTVLEGKTDGEPVGADIKIDKIGALLAIEVKQDAKTLGLPVSSYIGLVGAKRCWIEERGALTTLVIEGVNEEREWRLSLEFHPKQLWKRRLSVEGEGRDLMTFYSRDKDMRPSDAERRLSSDRGFYNY